MFPGMQCVAKPPYYSQCLEIEYDSTYTMCYRTVNGQGSGKSWGCTSNDDCCNPSAMCNTATKQCTLPCLNTIDTLHEHEESGESETEDAAASSLGMLGAPVFNLAALGIIFAAFLGGILVATGWSRRAEAAKSVMRVSYRYTWAWDGDTHGTEDVSDTHDMYNTSESERNIIVNEQDFHIPAGSL